nr:EOG090X0MTI [Artemia franciscana]
MCTVFFKCFIRGGGLESIFGHMNVNGSFRGKICHEDHTVTRLKVQRAAWAVHIFRQGRKLEVFDEEYIKESNFRETSPNRPWTKGQEASKKDDRIQTLMQKKQEIEQRTLNSTYNSLRMLYESESVGAQTAENLLRQREKLERTNDNLDGVGQKLRVSERRIQNIKSTFSSMKNYFRKPIDAGNPTVKIKGSQSTSSLSTSFLPQEIDSNRDSRDHPVLRRSELLKSRSQTFDSPRSVDEQLENNLVEISSALSRLKGLGIGLQEELDQQNAMIDRLDDKASKAGWKLDEQNKQMNKILKK